MLGCSNTWGTSQLLHLGYTTLSQLTNKRRGRSTIMILQIIGFIYKQVNKETFAQLLLSTLHTEICHTSLFFIYMLQQFPAPEKTYVLFLKDTKAFVCYGCTGKMRKDQSDVPPAELYDKVCWDSTISYGVGTPHHLPSPS